MTEATHRYVAWDGVTYQGQPPQGWHLAGDGRWWAPGSGPQPPAPSSPSADHPPPAASTTTSPPAAGERSMPAQYKIREEGRNGMVIIEADGLSRVIKKAIGKDDRQFIPFGSISFMEHNRKSLGSDVVVAHVGPKVFEWKVATDAEGFVDEVNARLARR